MNDDTQDAAHALEVKALRRQIDILSADLSKLRTAYAAQAAARDLAEEAAATRLAQKLDASKRKAEAMALQLTLERRKNAKLKGMEKSARWRAATLMADAVRRPGLKTLKLPFRLWRLSRSRK